MEGVYRLTDVLGVFGTSHGLGYPQNEWGSLSSPTSTVGLREWLKRITFLPSVTLPVTCTMAAFFVESDAIVNDRYVTQIVDRKEIKDLKQSTLIV